MAFTWENMFRNMLREENCRKESNSYKNQIKTKSLQSTFKTQLRSQDSLINF